MCRSPPDSPRSAARTRWCTSFGGYFVEEFGRAHYRACGRRVRRLTGADIAQCPVCHMARLGLVAIFRPVARPVRALDPS